MRVVSRALGVSESAMAPPAMVSLSSHVSNSEALPQETDTTADDHFAESPWCSPTCSVLLPIGIVLVILPLIWIVSGWLQMRFLKSHLKRLEKKPDELHTIRSPSSMKYGPWQARASRLIEDQKELIKNNSLQLGISLGFVLEELQPLYRERANKAEWRLDEWGPVTKSNFLGKFEFDVERGVAAWDKLQLCDPPKNPDFHQLAGLLAYGPHALGKGQICPRDGRADCSVVDALFKHDKSAKANWFFSWVWSYKLCTVVSALAEWWRRLSEKKGSSDQHNIYLWWCVFVNNQFRLLPDGSVEVPEDIFACFGRLLEGIGKMIICLDKIHGSDYTGRIWNIFEVHVAIQRDIKITLAIPPDALDIHSVATLEDIYSCCRVDTARARARVPADEDAIKYKILEEVGTFRHLNETVEQLLATEIFQLLSAQDSLYRIDYDRYGLSDYDRYDRYGFQDSRHFGVSLDFVLSEFKCLYRNKAPEAEWRLHDNCEVTESGFIVKVRDCCDVESGVVAWGDLDICSPPENPNFYQLAGLLAYGPHALGKGQICPRDGRADCSLVDALFKKNKSDNANWFLSWAWSYSLDVVCNALARWWDSHAAVVASEACPTGSVYLWWCFFVNNQFRMLEAGVTQDTDSLLKVFAEPLERAGKVLMCMDNFQNCIYTKRIWCIFEIFSAVRRDIPVTLIMPQLELGQEMETLTEMVHACRVDAWQATASVKADEVKIKTKIAQELKSFKHVNETVEKALWIEMIKMFKARKDKAFLSLEEPCKQYFTQFIASGRAVNVTLTALAASFELRGKLGCVMLQRVQSRTQGDRLLVQERVEQSKQILQKMAMAMQISRRFEIRVEEVDGMLKPELTEVWTALKTAVSAGHAMFLRMTGEAGPKEELRFLVKGFQNFFAASCIAAEGAAAEGLPDLKALLTEEHWQQMLEMLGEAWPGSYVEIVQNRLGQFKPTSKDNFLHLAARAGHRPIFQLLHKFPEQHREKLNQRGEETTHTLLIELMLKAGSLINAEDRLRWKCSRAGLGKEDAGERLAVHIAMRNNHFPTAQFLNDRWLEIYGSSKSSERRSRKAEQLAQRMVSLNEKEFLAVASETFTELGFFSQKESVDKKRTVGGLLAVFWIVADQYDQFVRGQEASNRLSKNSWEHLQESLEGDLWDWTRNTVHLTKSHSMVSAMLVYVAIMNVGKIKPFRAAFAPEEDEPTEALARILHRSPILVPSFAKLEAEQQQIILRALKADFNFGQFLQAENLPASLFTVRQILQEGGEDGAGSGDILGFFLFRNLLAGRG
eukprot:s11_g57.t1